MALIPAIFSWGIDFSVSLRNLCRLFPHLFDISGCFLRSSFRIFSASRCCFNCHSVDPLIVPVVSFVVGGPPCPRGTAFLPLGVIHAGNTVRVFGGG